MTKRGYITILFGFDYRSDEQEAEFRDAIHGDAEDTAQRYGFINYWETHDENMLAETGDASSIETDPKTAQRRGL